MARIVSRLFSSSQRCSARVNLNTVAHAPRTALTRRMMSSESHAGHGSTSGDRVWMVGSALVFGPLFLYLLSPSARMSSHGHADHGHNSHSHEHEDKHPVESHRGEDVKPMADDEGTEISSQEVKESIEKALEADSPKDAQEREAVVVKGEMTTAEEQPTAEMQPQAESSTDATPTPESEPHPTPVAPAVDEASNATSDEKVPSTASGTGAPAVDPKA